MKWCSQCLNWGAACYCSIAAGTMFQLSNNPEPLGGVPVMQQPRVYYIVSSGLCGVPKNASRLLAREYLPMATAMDTVANNRSVNIKVMLNRIDNRNVAAFGPIDPPQYVEALLDTEGLRAIILKYHNVRMGSESILLYVWEIRE